MVAIVILLTLLGIATWTDCLEHRIYNWNMYPGMLTGPLLMWAGLGPGPAGTESLMDCVTGFFVCGLIMLVAFVFFDLGGGDVKIIAMIGSFLGLERGIEALLWTFSIGFIIGISVIVWQHGAWNLLKQAVTHCLLILKAGGWLALNPDERQPLQRGLFLAPAAMIGTLFVIGPEIADWWRG